MTLMRRRWTIVKDVSQMRIASRTTDFSTHHAVSAIHNLRNVRRIEWLIETRPSRAGFEFRIGLVEWQAA